MNLPVGSSMLFHDSLIERVRAGDDRAFDDFMNGYSKRVFALVFHMIGTVEDTEDIVQEVFLRIYQKRRDIRIETVQVWVFQIARNCTYDRLRKKNREPIPEADLSDPEDDGGGFLDRTNSNSPDAEEVMLGAEQVGLLNSCLTALPARQRACLQLKYFEAMDQKDIAQILGTSDPTVSREIRRAERTLRKCLGAPSAE